PAAIDPPELGRRDVHHLEVWPIFIGGLHLEPTRGAAGASEMDREIVTLPGSLLFLRRYTHGAQGPDRGLVEQPLREVGTRRVHSRFAVTAEIGVRVLARVHVATVPAQLGAGHTTFDAARRHHATPDPVLAALVVQYVARPELGETQESRPLDGMGLIARCDQ